MTVLVEGANPAEVGGERRAGAADEAKRLVAAGFDTRMAVEHLTGGYELKRRDAYDLILRAREAADDAG